MPRCNKCQNLDFTNGVCDHCGTPEKEIIDNKVEGELPSVESTIKAINAEKNNRPGFQSDFFR